MAAIDNLTLTREKTSIGGEPDAGVPAWLEIPSNRAAFTLSRGAITERFVVRGHTLSGTVRLTALTINAFQRNRQAFREETLRPDFEDLWKKSHSPYEGAFVGPDWVSLHVNGYPFFHSRGSGTLTIASNERVMRIHDAVNLIEKVAKGGDVSEAVVREGLGAGTQGVFVRHETQTAVVLTESKGALKCAILERAAGLKRSVSFTVMTDKTPITLAAMLIGAGDIVELLNITEFMTRLAKTSAAPMAAAGKGDPAALVGQASPGAQTAAGPDATGAATAPETAGSLDGLLARPAVVDVSQARLAAALNRRKHLLDMIRGFEKAYVVRYRPDRPTAFDVTVPTSKGR